MRIFLAALSFLILTATVACTQSGDVATIEAVDNAAAKLDEAFEAQDASAIKALMTSDHVAVTHYYGEATIGGSAVIASLPDLKYEQTNSSEPAVTSARRPMSPCGRSLQSSTALTKTSRSRGPCSSPPLWSSRTASGWSGSTR